MPLNSQFIASFPEDCLPPEADYITRDALFEAINSWAAPKGYAFINGRSTKERSGKQTVTYICDRRRNHQIISKERQRKTTTRATGCEFSVLGKQSLDKTTWTVKHRSDKKFTLHNHEPSWNRTAHPVLRTLSKECVSQVSSLTNAGVAPREIRTYIRQNSNSTASQQDIYNCIADARRGASEGQSSINALADQLFKEGFWSHFQTDSDGRVKAVLFAHPDSIAYLEAYPDVLILDCTYKTNKYRMPLLDIIGVDACQRSFCIAFAFLSGESEEDYTWALDRLRSLFDSRSIRSPRVVLTDRCIACMNAVSTQFPASKSLLCLWHANKAVLRHCLPSFMQKRQTRSSDKESDMAAWNEFFGHWHLIMQSSDEHMYRQRVFDFEQKYLPTYFEEVAYIKATWLDPYKEKLVKAWVDRHLHFDNVVTSRVEGIHGLLKSHLKKSTLDLFSAWRAIKQALINQLDELKSNQAKQQIRKPIELAGSLYEVVRGWVSHEALRKVDKQRKLISKKDPPLSAVCSGSFAKSQGLPCVHKLQALVAQEQVLQLGHFHSHWHLIRKDLPRLLLEPRQRVDSIAVTSSLPMSSVRRELSGFELVETNTATRTQPLCSKCHILGHTNTSKECPLRYVELRALQTTTTESPGREYRESTIILSDNTHSPTSNAPQASEQRSTEHAERVHSGSGTISQRSSQRPIMEPGPMLPAASCEEPPKSTSIRASRDRNKPSIGKSSHQQDPDTTRPSRYDAPQAIHRRYVEDRDSWYKAQRPGTYVNNRVYRKAKGLPLGFKKESYEWCLDYKQMGKYCTSENGKRDWTKEEMMAYLDRDSKENERINAKAVQDLQNVRSDIRRRGMDEAWRRAEEDSAEQQVLHEAQQEQSCIIVKP